jgi:hypothetical protein
MPEDKDLQLLGAGIRASATEHPSQRSHNVEQQKEHRGRVADGPSAAEEVLERHKGVLLITVRNAPRRIPPERSVRHHPIPARLALVPAIVSWLGTAH